jgi:PAS domain S-box-containing protein
MESASNEQLLRRIEELENRLEESEQLIEAIKAGEVDAFAIGSTNKPEIYTLQSGDYAYRVLIEQFGEGAINVTEQGLIVYTNTYFFELLQLPYEKVIGASLFDFIQPDSLETFKQTFEQAIYGKAKGEFNLMVNDTLIPAYLSLTSLQPQLPSIGIIITDLTEKKQHEEVVLKYQRDLEIKNQELLHSNSDLASFAYVASHDLQEPLRKIQIFSKRILEKEYDELSASGKEYFQRLMTATHRMQSLIHDLLNYSRINTSAIIYTPTDLNSLLKEVKNDLNELIEETKTVIQADNLPVVDIIPNQFIQVLSNLITNAIKFRKSDINPVITINALIIPAAEIKTQVVLITNKYWKIQVSDNGIGFDQTYADRIFELFQRLHGRSEYEGTGIGLAICKKILQSHDGFIEAIGIPDVGATFNLYLPIRK